MKEILDSAKISTPPDFRKLFESSPDLYLAVSTDLKIIAVSDAYLKATARLREDILGKGIFEAFTQNPNDASASGVKNLAASISRVLKSKAPDVMAVQRYDIPLPEGGFTEMYWSSLNTPIFNIAGEIDCIVHRAENITESILQAKKHTESELNEEVFHAMVDSVKDYAIFMIDTTGHVLSWNDGAKQIKGYTAGEIMGKPISTFYTKEEIDNGEPAYNLKMAKENGRYESEGWRVRKDGSKFWADVVFTALYNADGKVKGFSKVTRDITERKNAEDDIRQWNVLLEERVKERTEKLQKSEKRYRDLFENSPLPMWVIDIDALRFLDVNEMAVWHFGYSREEFLAMSAYDLSPKSEQERVRKFDNSIDTGKHNYNVGVWRLLKKDGSIVYAEIMTHNVPFEGKRARLSLANDVTEKIKTEEKLQRSIKEITDYKYALDESAILAITDQKGIIKHVNDNFCKISKYSAEELIGQDHRIVNSGYHPKEFIRNLWVTIANGKIWKGELRNKAKDGTIYWVDTTIVPFLNDEAKPYQYVAIRSDITQRKQVEADILKLNNELEARVNLRTEQLESVNKELEAFSYSVSHDLRAPLRAINGYTQILKEDLVDKFSDEEMRVCDRIIYSTKKMGHLIDDLLAFSRLGRKELSKSTFAMAALVSDVIKDLNENNGAATIELQELHNAPADLGMIKQVWINLISNALKYSGHNDKAVIKIGSEQKDKEIIYHVTDNGVGFDMQYANKLFGVFQRLHSEAEFEGTGVGLAIVKRVVTKHDGKIWAEAKPNEGATFYFTLPD